MLKIPSPITDAKIGKVFHEIDWDIWSDQPAFKTPLVEFLRRSSAPGPLKAIGVLASLMCDV